MRLEYYAVCRPEGGSLQLIPETVRASAGSAIDAAANCEGYGDHSNWDQMEIDGYTIELIYIDREPHAVEEE